MLFTFLAGCHPNDTETVPIAPREVVETRITYRRVAVFDSGMDRLNGVALDSHGRIYLAGSGGVRIIDAAGQQLGTLATSEPAHCIAVAPGGDVYVALARQVVHFDVTGRIVRTWSGTGGDGTAFRVITGIAVAGADVYVADAGARRIYRFALDGDFVEEIDGRGNDPDGTGFICPSPHLDVAVDADGMLLVNNPGKRRVERYRPDGERLSYWGESGMEAAGFCGCCNPTDIAPAPGGRVVTAEKGIRRVKLYDADGRMLAYIGPEDFAELRKDLDPDARKADGLDVAADADGRIYVADPGDGKLRIFAPDADASEKEDE